MRIAPKFLPASVFALAALLSAPASAQDAAAPRLTQGEIGRLAELDAALFAATFEDCDAAAVRALIDESFEFYHDRGGLVAQDRDGFVAGIASNCRAIAAGQLPQVRRELVRSSLETHPIGSFGAAQTGRHNFYQLGDDGEAELRETARFLHMWRRTAEGWRLIRVVSYAHEAAR